ncbi:MAG: His-Xaa-Ser system radical SAM maturase HxsC [Deltaproteobacteria bacterium]|nr:His-Xaa-Ser system radical SAM maturase HxsC [Deltaproteobacteria bacterium]
MLKLRGKPKNLVAPLLGRVSFSSVKRRERSRTILVNPRLSARDLRDYLAVITAEKDIRRVKNDSIRIIYATENADRLCSGDVVELLPTGSINVHYQIHSNDNVIFVTSRCNCKCIMCPQPADINERSLLDLNLALVSLIDKSTQELALTGGEPTVVGEDLFRLILACKHFLPNTSLLLLTNGMKFEDYEYTRFFSSLKHPKLTVGVSLYGDNNIEHDFIVALKGAFNKTIRGVINLATFGNPIEVRIVIHRFTYQRLPRIAEFIYRNMTFVKHIAFMGLETIWRARENLRILWVEPNEIIPYLDEAIHYLRQRRMKVSIYNIPLCLLPDHLWDHARKSISGWKRFYHLECESCREKERCSGVFTSGRKVFKQYISPIQNSSPN